MSSTPLPARVVRLLVILLTLATALIHMGLAFQIPNGPDFIFLLNGLGYLVLVTLLYWPPPLCPTLSISSPLGPVWLHSTDHLVMGTYWPQRFFGVS
jgi:hypothetical protein